MFNKSLLKISILIFSIDRSKKNINVKININCKKNLIEGDLKIFISVNYPIKNNIFIKNTRSKL